MLSTVFSFTLSGVICISIYVLCTVSMAILILCTFSIGFTRGCVFVSSPGEGLNRRSGGPGRRPLGHGTGTERRTQGGAGSTRESGGTAVLFCGIISLN